MENFFTMTIKMNFPYSITFHHSEKYFSVDYDSERERRKNIIYCCHAVVDNKTLLNGIKNVST